MRRRVGRSELQIVPRSRGNGPIREVREGSLNVKDVKGIQTVVLGQGHDYYEQTVYGIGILIMIYC